MIYDLRQQVSTILIITGIKPYQCLTYIELSVIKYISVLGHKIHTGDKSAQMVVWLKIYFNINVLQINTIHTRENLFQSVYHDKLYDFADQQPIHTGEILYQCKSVSDDLPIHTGESTCTSFLVYKSGINTYLMQHNAE